MLFHFNNSTYKKLYFFSSLLDYINNYFFVSKRVKQIEYKQSLARTYFWRTKQQQEVNFVEENGTKVFGFEFKWNKKKNQKPPKTFIITYNAESMVID